MHPRFVLLLLLTLLLASNAAALDRPASRATRAAAVVQPTPEDVAAMRSAADVALSPDGTRIVYSLGTATLDPDAKPSEKDTDAGWKRDRQVWVVDAGGGEPHQLTRGVEQAKSPVWSPTGKEVAFLRKVKGKSVLHVIAIDGGEASLVATGDLEPASVRWSPDGKWFGFLADPVSKKADEEKWKSGGAIDWGRDYENTALWVVARAGGEPRRVSKESECITAFDWSPDGTKFAILSATSGDPYEQSNHLTPRVIAVKDGATVCALPAKPADFASLRWSPDGRRLGVLTTHESLSMENELRVYEIPSGTNRNALPDFDHTVSSFAWSSDSRSVIALVRERTFTKLVRFAADGSSAGEDLGFQDRVADAPLTTDRGGSRLAFLSSTDRDPRDPTIFDLGTRTAKVAAHLNPEVASWSLGRDEVVHWKSENGIEVEGLLLVSPAAKPGAPAPLLVMPHGGPDDVSSRSFSALSQFFAAHGISVLRPNYRGSFGYGREFYAANRGRLGEIEFRDIESGVDALIAQKKADPAKLLYGGWSWGGYLTAWTIGHTSRYKAAVVGAGVNDVFVQYAVSDINHGDASQWEYRGNPWLELDHFDRSNPIRFAKDMKTPTLILHGQSDPRVGFAASQELHRALLDLGVPTRFYAYPREPHNLLEPAHVAHRTRVWLDWYQTYLKSPAAAAIP